MARTFKKKPRSVKRYVELGLPNRSIQLLTESCHQTVARWINEIKKTKKKRN